jgi:hypothetical protein
MRFHDPHRRLGSSDQPAPTDGVREAQSHRAGLLTPPPATYTTGHRYGCFEEILVTFVGHPRESVPDVVPGTVFQAERRRLRVDPTSLYVEDNELRWAATLRTHRWWWRRRATLRMFGSPSTNVTVLTLTPTRPHRLATRAFVRQGRRAMTELRDRIDRRPVTTGDGARVHPRE